MPPGVPPLDRTLARVVHARIMRATSGPQTAERIRLASFLLTRCVNNLTLCRLGMVFAIRACASFYMLTLQPVGQASTVPLDTP